jgi:hypothetical protein
VHAFACFYQFYRFLNLDKYLNQTTKVVAYEH